MEVKLQLTLLKNFFHNKFQNSFLTKTFQNFFPKKYFKIKKIYKFFIKKFNLLTLLSLIDLEVTLGGWRLGVEVTLGGSNL